MFKVCYQGGAVVEVFSAQGREPVTKWKLSGGQSAIRKKFDKDVKGFVYCLEVGLLQRFLVLQVNIPQFKDFSTELVITDLGHLKRRLYLSTVHKELSATPLHARIPFVGLEVNIWCNLRIDLVSFTGGLYKSTGFLTLDGITVSASCKLRRIFTMKTDPTGTSSDMLCSGVSVVDMILRSCQFLPDVHHVTQVLNMERLQQAGVRTGLVSSDCAPDHSTTGRPTSCRKPNAQESSHIAFGSRVLGLASQTWKKSARPLEGVDGKAHPILNTRSSDSARVNQESVTESQKLGDLSDKSTCGDSFPTLHRGEIGFELAGRPGSLQPQPPKDRVFDRQGSKKLRVHSAGQEKLAAFPDVAPYGHKGSDESREMSTPPVSRQGRDQQPLTPAEIKGQLTADEFLRDTSAEERDSTTIRPAEFHSCWLSPGSCTSDPQVNTSHGESDEGSRPLLSLGEEVFTFSSLPHSARRGQGHGNQGEMETSDDPVQNKTECNRAKPEMTSWEAKAMREILKAKRGHEPPPHPLFVVWRIQDTGHKDSSPWLTAVFKKRKDKIYNKMLQKRENVGSSLGTPRVLDPTGDSMRLKVRPGTHSTNQTSPNEPYPTTTIMPTYTHVPAGIVPTRCLSPSGGRRSHEYGAGLPRVANRTQDENSSTSLCRRFLREVLPEECSLDKETEEMRQAPTGSGHCDLQVLSSQEIQGDEEEELRMLASLQREQEEEEYGGASGLSSSQRHQCNVSISMSSDDASTWSHILAPTNQGQHYYREMISPLHSDPREWIDMLSPPIIPPSQQRRAENTQHHHKDLIREKDLSTNGESDDEYLNLLYDPRLNCYFDPQTGKYYELA